MPMYFGNRAFSATISCAKNIFSFIPLQAWFLVFYQDTAEILVENPKQSFLVVPQTF